MKLSNLNRYLLMTILPSWMLSIVFISIVLAYYFGLIARRASPALFILVVFLGVAAIIISLYSTYIYIFIYDVGIENTARMRRIYMDGHLAWDYLESKTSSLECYEASVLEMMAWRGHDSVFYVFANIWDNKKHRYDHSWIEVKRFGVWWIIDPTRGDPVIIAPRWVYNLVHCTRYIRAFNSYGFWSSTLANNFYEQLCERSTSYLSEQLKLFRRDTDTNSMYADTMYINKLEGESNPI